MSIGETLRQARMQSGLTLDEISGRTRINVNLLQAMEADELHRLPNGAIGRNFVKQYAQMVGVDPGALARELAELSPPAPAAAAQRPTDSFRPRVASINERPRAYSALVGSLLWVIAVIVVCSGVYWLMTRTHGQSAPAQRPASTQK